jgi:hypothetical protein
MKVIRKGKPSTPLDENILLAYSKEEVFRFYLTSTLGKSSTPLDGNILLTYFKEGVSHAILAIGL